MVKILLAENALLQSPYAKCYMHREYQALFNKLIPISLIVLLSACGATQSPPYQKDSESEDRDQYSGAEGMAQYQKDQSYLFIKELSDKYTKAKIDSFVVCAYNKLPKFAAKSAAGTNSYWASPSNVRIFPLAMRYEYFI